MSARRSGRAWDLVLWLAAVFAGAVLLLLLLAALGVVRQHALCPLHENALAGCPGQTTTENR